MQEHTKIFSSPWLLAVLSAGLGFLVGLILERFKNRTVLLKFKKDIFQLATATQNNFWGNIEVLYNNRKTNHLSLMTIELKNDSNIDLENVNVDFWVDESSQMLAHQGNYVESGNSVSLEENYLNELVKVLELQENIKLQDEASDQQSNLTSRIRFILANKKFNLSVFNRNTSIKFQILVENFEGRIPALSLSVLHKSCRLVREEDEIEKKKKRDRYVGIIWILLIVISVTVLQINFHNSPYGIIWSGITVFLSLYIALAVFEIFKFIKKIWR